MTDRELLEAAARAAGLALHQRCIGDDLILAGPFGAAGAAWNPLTDDGDALRLAVKLRMVIDCEDAPEEADRNAAVRRAIVLAAASNDA